MTAGCAASRRVLARTPVAPLPASSPTRPVGINGRTSAPPDSSLPDVCSFQLPKVCSFRLPLTGAAGQSRGLRRDRRFNVLHLEPLKRTLEIEGRPLGLDRGLERRCFRRQFQTQLESQLGPSRTRGRAARLGDRDSPSGQRETARSSCATPCRRPAAFSAVARAFGRAPRRRSLVQ